VSQGHTRHLAAMSGWCPHLLRRGSALTVRNLTGFAGVREEALAADRAIHDAHCTTGPFVSRRRLN
jgi:hypothetical protein